MNHKFARELRRNMTDEERQLWRLLRQRQLGEYKFRRQAPIGRYVVDFVSFQGNLVVELDGGQHAEQIEEDQLRSQWLNSRGFRIVRFWNHEIKESPDAVLEVIWRALQCVTPHPNPPPQGGREQDDPPPQGQAIKTV